MMTLTTVPNAPIFYRYVDGYDDNANVVIIEERYIAVKETEKGYWVQKENVHYAKKRWISKEGNSKYCHITKEAALCSFVARKESQFRILKHQMSRCLHVKEKISDDMLTGTTSFRTQMGEYISNRPGRRLNIRKPDEYKITNTNTKKEIFL